MCVAAVLLWYTLDKLQSSQSATSHGLCPKTLPHLLCIYLYIFGSSLPSAAFLTWRTALRGQTFGRRAHRWICPFVVSAQIRPELMRCSSLTLNLALGFSCQGHSHTAVPLAAWNHAPGTFKVVFHHLCSPACFGWAQWSQTLWLVGLCSSKTKNPTCSFWGMQIAHASITMLVGMRLSAHPSSSSAYLCDDEILWVCSPRLLNEGV